MTTPLTDIEKKQIDSYAYSFWADFKVMVYERAVILYVDSSNRDFDYPAILRYDDYPHEVMQMVLDYEGYKNRPTVSARDQRSIFERHGDFSGTQDIQVEAAKHVAKHPLSWIEESGWTE